MPSQFLSLQILGGIYKLHITSHKTGTKRWRKVVVLML